MRLVKGWTAAALVALVLCGAGSASAWAADGEPLTVSADRSDALGVVSVAQADGDADPEDESDLRLVRRESSQQVDAAVIALWSIAGVMTVLLGVYVWHTSPRRRLRLARRRVIPLHDESPEAEAQPSDLVPEQRPETPSDLVSGELSETPSDLVSGELSETPSDLVSGELSETPSEPALEQLPSTPAAEVPSPGAVPTVEDRGVWELAEAELRGGAGSAGAEAEPGSGGAVPEGSEAQAGSSGAGPAGAEAEPSASAAAAEESDAQRSQGFWPRLRHVLGLD